MHLQGMSQGVPQGMPQGMQQGMQQGVPQGVGQPYGVSQPFPSYGGQGGQPGVAVPPMLGRQ